MGEFLPSTECGPEIGGDIAEDNAAADLASPTVGKNFSIELRSNAIASRPSVQSCHSLRYSCHDTTNGSTKQETWAAHGPETEARQCRNQTRITLA